MRIILISLLLFPFIVQAQVSGVEKKIIKSVDKHNAAAEALLKHVVNMNSGSMNFEGVKRVGRVFKEKFDELGFNTTWVDGKAFNRAGHLVAVHKGKDDALKLLLIGHLDTVFEPESPNQEYTMVNDTIMKGPGVVDMKGGDVIILHAVQALKDAGVLDKLTIEVVMTGDEEKSGSPIHLSKQAITAAAKRADIALGFENGDSNFRTAVISRRGSTRWQLKVTGEAAHSSQIFSEKIGAGAIYEASRILTEFYKQLSSEKYLTFNPGLMLAGSSVEYTHGSDGGSAGGKNNVVAKDALVTGDIRAVSPEQLERAKKVMQNIVAKNYPKTSAILTFSESGYPPLAPSEGNKKLLEIYSKTSEDLGFGKVTPVHPINAGAADVSFTSGLVEAAMDGIGLSGGKDHTIDEFGELHRLPVLTKRAAVFMYRLTLTK
ncbi:M20 family metallopeptidase [Fulvivirga sp. M361]|uniref:M20/M25/M40 family metallo-hydrolase n=1 Tax=Fulvivirga sp. M361 TaxID=2594266 RepID=UPI00117B9C69|nr:M20/M25/M40 family metallo-hydrolase [Fulvivirga sp. M361]TRX48922.1 M20 family metallopeptidase [Fulvivirga sp. M361]